MNQKGRRMSDMKCPFCQQELDTSRYYIRCHNPHCDITEEMEDTEEMWTALIRTRKALEIATGFIKGISQTIINDCDNQYVVLGNFKKFAQDTLNQIKTALEQKD